MPKLKVEDDELDVEALEEAEYEEGQFEKYDGEQPPKDTELVGYVKSMWWTYTANDDPMIKMLFVAEGNVGEEEEYNGLPIWENYALTTGAKFKWDPFFQHVGITIRDVKTKLYVGEEDDDRMNGAAPIEKIAKFVPGEDSDDAWAKIVTTRERYEGKWQTHIGEWLPYEEPDGEAAADPDEDETEPEEPEEEARPTRGRSRTTQAPARGATAGSGRGRKPAAKPAASKPAARGGRTPTKPASTKPAGRGRGRRTAADADDEPPF